MVNLPADWQDLGMGISAHDIRDVDFKTRLRGYDPEEVDRFLEKISSMVTLLRQELEQHKNEKKEQAEKLEYFHTLERHIQDAIVLARKTAEEVVTNARKEADLILAQANLQAREAQNDLSRIKSERDRCLLELRGLLQSQLAGLERLLDQTPSPGGHENF